MKTAIVYFSLEGNCDYVANKLADNMSGEVDIIRIETVKPYPMKGFKKFAVGGMSAVRKDKPKIMPLKFDANAYDLIVLGTPVWANTFAPPLRTFFMNNYIHEKPIAIFATSSSGACEKTFERLKEALEGCKFLNKHLSLSDPLSKQKDEDLKAIKDFASYLEKGAGDES